MALTLSEKTTHFTQVHDKVITKMVGNQDCIYREQYHFYQLTNPKQMDHIINNIIIEKGFLTEKFSSDLITFTRPQNSNASSIWYEYFPKDRTIKKFQHFFLSNV